MAEWLATREFAERYSLSRQRASNLLAEFAGGRQKPWNGFLPLVREVSSKGGRGGKTYEVAAASLPPLDESEENLPVVVPAALPAPLPNSRLTEWEWKAELLRPALEAETPDQRRAAIRAVASVPQTDWRGVRRQVGEGTLYRWLQRYREGGLGELLRQPRADRGRSKVIVSRAYDSIVPFEPEVLRLIRKKIDALIKGFIVHNKVETLRRRVITFEVERNLREWTLELLDTIVIPEQRLAEACKCQPSWIDQHRGLRKAGFLIHNNKRFMDDQPRIRRSLPKRPMQRVVVDVRKVNIRVTDIGAVGVIKTAYEIGFMDVATGRHLSVHQFFANGGAVRNVDMIEAVAFMVSHPEWGIPETLQFDNGKENNFAAMLQPILELRNSPLWTKDRKAPVIQAARGVRAEFSYVYKALPYNAPAKEVERSFRAVNELETHIVGFIDDDRMKALQAAPGRLVAPHGSADSFFAHMEERDVYFNNLPRGGRYENEAPNARYQRLCRETGHVPVVMDADEFRACFTEPREMTVRQHRVRLDNRHWGCPELDASFVDWVTVHVPRYHGFNMLFAQLPTGEHVRLVPDQEVEFDDRRGAIRSSEQKGRAARAARELINAHPQPQPFGGVIEVKAEQAEPLPPNVHVLKSHRPKDPELAIVPSAPKKRRAGAGRVDPLEVLQLRQKGKRDV